MKNRIITLIALAVLVGGSIGFIATRHNNDTQATATTSPSPTVTADVTYVTYAGEDGKNALELLQKSHTVSTKTESFGTYVQGIDGKEGDTKHYWSFYVNGTAASVGADSYVSKSTDKIEWKYEEIK